MAVFLLKKVDRMMNEVKQPDECWEQRLIKGILEMRSFKTQQECLEALLKGEWLSNEEKDLIRHMDSGRVVNERGEHVTTCFNDPERWFTYTPPKEKKKIKLAPSLTKDKDGHYHVTHALHESVAHAKDCCSWSFVRWLVGTPYELEVEVGDE